MIVGSQVIIKKLKIGRPPFGEDGGRLLTDNGEIAQIINGSTFQFLAYLDFDCKNNLPRGNHFHVNKDEILYIIKGKLRAIYEDQSTKQREEVVVEAGDLIRVTATCAHAYVPLEYTQILEFSSSKFDHFDTHRYVLI